MIKTFLNVKNFKTLKYDKIIEHIGLNIVNNNMYIIVSIFKPSGTTNFEGIINRIQFIINVEKLMKNRIFHLI